MRFGLEACGGAGPTSLSSLLDREAWFGGSEGPTVRRGDFAEGGGAGPATLRRLSPESGLRAHPRRHGFVSRGVGEESARSAL
jgi:hypothetical protein